MNRLHPAFAVPCAALALGVASLAHAAATPAPAAHVALAPSFGDHMVLQRERAVPVWGTATPGGAVWVAIDRDVRQATADASGRWSVRMGARPAGGPFVLRAWGRDTVVASDVMMGDVWLASGQSNMEMPVRGWGKVLNADAEVEAADHPDIRLLTIERNVAFAPERDAKTADWQRCSPATIANFSATAYFFGRALHDSLHVPIGLVHASWGGTEIEAWTRPAALAAVPGLAGPLRETAARAAFPPDSLRREFARATAAWLAAVPRGERGSNATPRWPAPELDEHDWKPMTLPTDWENAGLPDLDGVVWFRRRVEIPAQWSGRALTLSLGRIDDADTSYFDGVAVGNDSVYDRPRRYTVPAPLVTPGPHTIAVRVYDWGGGGGLWGDAAMMKLQPAAGDTSGALALDGPWRYRIGLDFTELPPRPRDPGEPNQPGVLANGMIAPLVPYALRGVIWYQGEANASRAEQYRALLPCLIGDWRRWWNAPALPFVFVQLAGFGDPAGTPGENDWAELREAQAMATSVPHTGMACALDIGEAHDIHPRNKQEVGRRLALAALNVAYGRGEPASGPVPRRFEFGGARAFVHFDHVARGLVARGGGEPAGFALAGEDRMFHWARARIVGDTVELTCDAVPHPVAVRYAWGANPRADLAGGSGLPAPPFRSDRWPGITHDRH